MLCIDFMSRIRLEARHCDTLPNPEETLLQRDQWDFPKEEDADRPSTLTLLNTRTNGLRKLEADHTESSNVVLKLGSQNEESIVNTPKPPLGFQQNRTHRVLVVDGAEGIFRRLKYQRDGKI
jgi:hypothetical protein